MSLCAFQDGHRLTVVDVYHGVVIHLVVEDGEREGSGVGTEGLRNGRDGEGREGVGRERSEGREATISWCMHVQYV